MSKTQMLKSACYGTNVSMAVVACLSPVLFLTFRSLYGISYSLLGLLVLTNFVTQLTVDLIFSIFSYKIDIAKAVKFTPFLAVVGLILYGTWPFIFPNNIYVGLVLGTVLFSAASGFAEVLISPVIAAIPSPDPDKEMSKLHSVYAWGSVFVVIFSTVFLLVFGQENWQYLALIFALIPLFSSVMFAISDIPYMSKPDKMSGVIGFFKNPNLWLCVFAIFLGGAAECTMAQWASGYLEMAMGLPKIWGDIFGVALFSVALGFGRTLYSKIGKNIERVLLWGAVGAFACYITAALCPIPVIGLLGCAFTGFCVSMLWPGSLIVASSRIPDAGVVIFAMMAAGGDFGASVGPQIIGVVTDAIMALPAASGIAGFLNVTLEQLGMKAGMLIGAIFPFVGIFVYRYLLKTSPREKENEVR